MSKCCESRVCCTICRKIMVGATSLVSTLGSIGYCFYLIWLLANLKANNYYWFLVFIPAIFSLFALAHAVTGNFYLAIDTCVCSVVLTVMCTFTMLTRLAYYHLSPDDSFGPIWVIWSLKGSIIFSISSSLAQRRCHWQEIMRDKDAMTRGLLDFVDIFELADLLSLDNCVGGASSVTEMSYLEMATQAFCVMSFFIFFDLSIPKDVNISNKVTKFIGTKRAKMKIIYHKFIIYSHSLFVQNFPFLILRFFFLTKHRIFSLGLLVKNLFAIVISIAELFQMICTNSQPSNNIEIGSDNKSYEPESPQQQAQV